MSERKKIKHWHKVGSKREKGLHSDTVDVECSVIESSLTGTEHEYHQRVLLPVEDVIEARIAELEGWLLKREHELPGGSIDDPVEFVDTPLEVVHASRAQAYYEAARMAVKHNQREGHPDRGNALRLAAFLVEATDNYQKWRFVEQWGAKAWHGRNGPEGTAEGGKKGGKLTEEDKRRAVRLILEADYTQEEAAKEVGVRARTLSRHGISKKKLKEVLSPKK